MSTTEQPTIFDAIRERDEAIARIELNTIEAFKHCARQAVLKVGLLQARFSSDDVWDWLQTHDSVQAHDNRALGAVMAKLHKDKLIRPTGDYVPSKRRHMSPIRVWALV